MTTEQIAQLIPEEYRTEILLLNMISGAQVTITDATMQYLATIWKNYVEPDFKGDCPLCLERLLKNYRELEPVMIDMQKRKNLLADL